MTEDSKKDSPVEIQDDDLDAAAGGFGSFKMKMPSATKMSGFESPHAAKIDAMSNTSKGLKSMGVPDKEQAPLPTKHKKGF
ncbi:MAG: hypothetical protein AAGC81_14080 [Pseudomonadota bacterium]